MAKSFNEKRLVFKKGRQRKLLEEFVLSLQMKQSGASSFFGITPRSFTDWVNEKTKLPASAYNKIPLTIRKRYRPKKVLEKFWYTKKGSRLGAKALMEKYGKMPINEDYRKRKWREWWEMEGSKSNRIVGITKTYKKPRYSKRLAEFIGIMMGDGGITEYQSVITLNKETDSEYILYVEKLIFNLFGIDAKKSYRKNTKAVILVVSRKLLNQYLVSLGLKLGNKLKQNFDIPFWIMKNKEYSKMCLRGLVDTDGCVFHETHNIKGKKYSYARLNFVTASSILASSVMKILTNCDFNPRLRKNGKNYAVQLENKREIWQYFKVIGTSNPKHLERLSNY